MQNTETIKSEVKNYYGQVLSSTSDLKTNACCDTEVMPNHIKTALSNISDEVITKYYGCGLTIPTNLVGLTVLDLGSGAGRDCFIMSQLVGEKGQVIGVDMTEEQLEVANRNINFHTKKFGYQLPNVNFIKGDLEQLNKTGIAKESLDVIVSNCVINLVPDKEAVLSQAYELLKPGGEIFFSDVYCNRRIPQELINDKELYGECLSGALYWNDFENLSKKVGFTDPRVVESRPLEVSNARLEEKLIGYDFYSVTYRLFKLEQLETHCEDYGQAVVYKGGIPESAKFFKLDDHHIFLKGKFESVCGNTYNMLKETRFKSHFDFIGNFEEHYGIFKECGLEVPYNKSKTPVDNTQGACC